MTFVLEQRRASRSSNSISAPVTNLPRCLSPGASRSSSIRAPRPSPLFHQGSMSAPLRPHASLSGVDGPSRLMTPRCPDRPSGIRAATPIPVQAAREDIAGDFSRRRSLATRCPDCPSSIRAVTPIPVRAASEDIAGDFFNRRRSLTNMPAYDPWPEIGKWTTSNG